MRICWLGYCACATAAGAKPKSASAAKIARFGWSILIHPPRSFSLRSIHPMTSTLRFSEWRPHPWHGLPTGREPPVFVNAYVEITPFDHIKYEVDKASGYLRVDR